LIKSKETNMKNRSRSQFAVTTVVLLTAALLPSRALAQPTKEVEIEVAGPWSYVPDPSDGKRVLIIAPVGDHGLSLLEGGDVTDYESAKIKPGPGRFQLDVQGFNSGNCKSSTSSPHPYELPSVPDSAIKSALNLSGKRYAVSLPKPCFYESYEEARVIVDTKAIVDKSKEASYTTWMVLHYTVQDTSKNSVLNGQSDDGNDVYKNRALVLTADAHPSALAVSIILFRDRDLEDYKCDQHSADFFDEVMSTLWGQNLHRLFPELRNGGPLLHGQQTARYNYDCVQTQATKAVAHHTGTKSASPGRTDCHMMQVDLNHTIVPK
jgi:hypothetical protein